jgi:hypothetical protein
MGQLRNTLRETCVNGTPLVTGLIPIGDARCHTNPTFAYGLSLSLGHARALADAADAATDDVELATGFEVAVGTLAPTGAPPPRSAMLSALRDTSR